MNMLRSIAPYGNANLFSVYEVAKLTGYCDKTIRRMIHNDRVVTKNGWLAGNKKAYWLELSEINKIRGWRHDPPLTLSQALAVLRIEMES
jgi:hypothetical protein